MDPTWCNDGCLYEGVVFDRKTINRIALETGFWELPALEWEPSLG